MNELEDTRQILGERNREEKYLDSPWSQKLRNVQIMQWPQRWSQLLRKSCSLSQQKEGKAISPCRKPAPPAQNRDISVPPTSLIVASIEDLTGPAPSDTLHPLRTADDANRKFHHDYRDWSILPKRYQTSFHRGPREATGLQRHVTLSDGTQHTSSSHTRHPT